MAQAQTNLLPSLKADFSNLGIHFKLVNCFQISRHLPNYEKICFKVMFYTVLLLKYIAALTCQFSVLFCFLFNLFFFFFLFQDIERGDGLRQRRIYSNRNWENISQIKKSPLQKP